MLHFAHNLPITHNAYKNENEIISFLHLFCHVANLLKPWSNFEKRINKYVHPFLDLSIIFLFQSVSETKHSVTWTLSAMHLAVSLSPSITLIVFWVVIMRRICNFKCLYLLHCSPVSFLFIYIVYKICYQTLKRIQRALQLQTKVRDSYSRKKKNLCQPHLNMHGIWDQVSVFLWYCADNCNDESQKRLNVIKEWSRRDTLSHTLDIYSQNP